MLFFAVKHADIFFLENTFPKFYRSSDVRETAFEARGPCFADFAMKATWNSM